MCEHQRRRRYCRDCGYIPKLRPKDRCVECGGGGICNTKSAEAGAKTANGPRARKQNTKSTEKKLKTRGEKQ